MLPPLGQEPSWTDSGSGTPLKQRCSTLLNSLMSVHCLKWELGQRANAYCKAKRKVIWLGSYIMELCKVLLNSICYSMPILNWFLLRLAAKMNYVLFLCQEMVFQQQSLCLHKNNFEVVFWVVCLGFCHDSWHSNKVNCFTYLPIEW